MSIDINEKGRLFERRVGSLFRLLGYTVDVDRLISGRQVDLYIEHREGPLVRKYIVECKDQAKPVSTAQYDSFRGKLSAAKVSTGPKLRGIMVSSVGFVREAKAQCDADDIELLTISDLETSIVDFRGYVHELLAEQALRPDPHFVEPRLRREYLELPEPAHGMIDEWLVDPVANQLTLLGDFGTGKTTFLRHLAYRLASRYAYEVLERGGRARIPLYVDLREHSGALSLKQLMLAFFDQHAIRASSFAAFEYILQDGQVVLILDGFDEMASRGNLQLTLANFRELNRAALGRAKIILSCRTHYFTTHAAVRTFHGDPSSELARVPSFTDLYREIAARPNFLITYLMEFGVDQVDEYLRLRCGERWRDVRSFIDSTYNLEELSRRPVLLNMIVGSEQRIHDRPLTVSPGVLYEIYTNLWLAENDWSIVISPDLKARLLEQFAYRTVSEPGLQIQYRQIPGLVRAWAPEVSEENALLLDQELRRASFLVRDADGYYRFSHRSFQEFFYARHLLREADNQQPESWNTGWGTEVYRFLRDLIPSHPAARLGLLRWAAESAAPETVRVNAIKCLGGSGDATVAGTLLEILASSAAYAVRKAAAAGLSGARTPAVVQALAAGLDGDPSRDVRTACFISLGRLNCEAGNAYLLNRLHSEGRAIFAGLWSWAVYRSAPAFSPDIIESLILIAPTEPDRHGQGRRELIRSALDLCAIQKTELAFEYCARVVRSSPSPKLVLAAFATLPVERRRLLANQAIEVIERVERQMNATTFEERLECLRGVCTQEIGRLLLRLLSPRAGSRIHPAAFEILASDYPESVLPELRTWMGGGRPYWLRVRAARETARRQAPEALQEILSLLAPGERVITKLETLKIVAEHYPIRLPEVVEGFWEREPTAIVKRHACELLMRVDPARCLKLLLERALGDRRVGTRVSACAILSAVPSVEVTEALLDRLGNDHSPWVRVQALKSLVSPGRVVARETIRATCRSETDREVLATLSELLGPS